MTGKTFDEIMILNEKTTRFEIYEIVDPYTSSIRDMIERPFVWFDVETTGLSFKDDRLLSLAAIRLDPKERDRAARLVTFFDPGVDVIISPKITELTGISRKMLNEKKAPVFSEVAEEIALFFDGCDLGGFNVSFDVQMIESSFMRAAIPIPFAEDAVTLDPYRIFRKMYPHNLATAYDHYTGEELTGAHDALIDIEATIQVAENQILLYDWEDLSLSEIRTRYTAPYIDDDQRFYRDDEGKVRLGFGKYKDELLAVVLMSRKSDHVSYVRWMQDNLSSASVRVLNFYLSKLSG